MLSQQFRVFLTVAECGSFSGAAKKLLVTPASVMKHMNALEARIGAALLIRTHRGVALTAAGRSLYEDGRKMEALEKEAAARARAASSDGRIVIRVGSSLLNPSRVLTDLWPPFRPKYPMYRFRIIPYEDTREHILSVIASLGTKIDVLVGSFNSRTMLQLANYRILGRYRLCVAVPRDHPLARKERLVPEDLHGEMLRLVKSGDTDILDRFRSDIRRAHPQIRLEETGYFYDMDTFNTCERDGVPLLVLDAWSGIHPALVTLPVRWDYAVPYGILYSRTPSEKIVRFLDILESSPAP